MEGSRSGAQIFVFEKGDSKASPSGVGEREPFWSIPLTRSSGEGPGKTPQPLGGVMWVTSGRPETFLSMLGLEASNWTPGFIPSFPTEHSKLGFHLSEKQKIEGDRCLLDNTLDRKWCVGP